MLREEFNELTQFGQVLSGTWGSAVLPTRAPFPGCTLLGVSILVAVFFSTRLPGCSLPRCVQPGPGISACVSQPHSSAVGVSVLLFWFSSLHFHQVSLYFIFIRSHPSLEDSVSVLPKPQPFPLTCCCSTTLLSHCGSPPAAPCSSVFGLGSASPWHAACRGGRWVLRALRVCALVVSQGGEAPGGVSLPLLVGSRAGQGGSDT